MTTIRARRPIAVVALTRGGARLGERLARALDGAELYVEQRFLSLVEGPARPFALPLGPLLAELFPRYPSLVLFLAVGAAVRLLAPLLGHKARDPAVVTVDEAGRFAVCLLSGHLGRGEALAREVAAALSATPVVTTASAAMGLPAVDLLGAERGWRLEEPAPLTEVAATLVNGETVAFLQEAGEPAWEGAPPPGIVPYTDWPSLLADRPPRCLVVTDRLLPRDEMAALGAVLVYRPPTLVAGVGCRRGVPGDEIAAFVGETLCRLGLSSLSLYALATADIKAAEPGLLEAARLLHVPLLSFSREEMESVAHLVTPSASRERLGLPSVSEAAALLASGANRLLAPRARSGRVTVAVARREASP